MVDVRLSTRGPARFVEINPPMPRWFWACLLWFSLSGQLSAASAARPVFHHQLQQARAQLQAEHPQRALERLAAASPANAYETALREQLRAYALLAAQRPQAAYQAFSKALHSGQLPHQVNLQLHGQLFRLSMDLQRYQDAVTHFAAWNRQPKKLSAAAYALAAKAYQETSALAEAAKALRVALQRSDEPRPEWRAWLRELYRADGQHEQEEALLRETLRQAPQNAQNWRALADFYQQQQRWQKALATWRLAQRQGLLQAPQDVLRLVKLYLSAGLPRAAAELLAARLADGAVPATADNQRLLASSWEQARDWDAALAVWQQVDGAQSHLAQARLLLRLARWDAAQAALEQARQQGAQAAQWQVLQARLARLRGGG